MLFSGLVARNMSIAGEVPGEGNTKPCDIVAALRIDPVPPCVTYPISPAPAFGWPVRAPGELDDCAISGILHAP